MAGTSVPTAQWSFGAPSGLSSQWQLGGGQARLRRAFSAQARCNSAGQLGQIKRTPKARGAHLEPKGMGSGDACWAQHAYGCSYCGSGSQLHASAIGHLDYPNLHNSTQMEPRMRPKRFQKRQRSRDAKMDRKGHQHGPRNGPPPKAPRGRTESTLGAPGGPNRSAERAWGSQAVGF